MDIKVTFPGDLQVNAELGSLTVVTNQDGTAPSPFALFLASIGACAGIYALNFCRQRGIATDGMEITQRMIMDPATHLTKQITLDIKLPENFPDKYREAVIRAVDQCAVKKHLQQPPQINVVTS